jgi:hypothetical protein
MNHRIFLLLIVLIFSACNRTTEQQSNQEITQPKIILDTINSTIPTPTVKTGLHRPGYNPDDLFHLFSGIGLWNKANEIEERCEIISYKIVWKTQNTYGKDTIYYETRGGSNGRVNETMESSKVGDRFIFQDIEIICDGDQRNRRTEDFVITIK